MMNEQMPATIIFDDVLSHFCFPHFLSFWQFFQFFVGEVGQFLIFIKFQFSSRVDDLDYTNITTTIDRNYCILIRGIRILLCWILVFPDFQYFWYYRTIYRLRLYSLVVKKMYFCIFSTFILTPKKNYIFNILKYYQEG